MIKPAEFIHPEDEAALRQLESIPGFPALVKKIMALGFEKLRYGMNMATAIRLSPTQSWAFQNLSFTCKWTQNLMHGLLVILRYLSL